MITITAVGSGYTSAPTVSINGGCTATATATVNNGVVTGLTITNGGSGYTSPTVTMTAPTVGITATANATISDSISNSGTLNINGTTSMVGLTTTANSSTNINANTTVTSYILFPSSSTIAIANNIALTAKGNIGITSAGGGATGGTFTGAGKVVYNGTTTQVIGCSFNNVDLNTTVPAYGLSGNQIVNGLLHVISGQINASASTLTLANNGLSSATVDPLAGFGVISTGQYNFNGRPVTFRSDATGTARFTNAINGSGSIVGATNVTVERYIPSLNRKAFVMVGSPITSTIKAGWQEGGTNTNTGYGTLITGKVSTGDASGLDGPSTSNYSLFTYDDTKATGSKWVPVTNTTSAAGLAPGNGYLIYVRGDRTGGSVTNNSNTTLRATGTLGSNNGTIATNGTTATATAVLTSGTVTGFTGLVGGSGYGTTIPIVTIAAPTSGTTATATAVMTSGAVTNFNITNAGSGYTAAPTVTITSPFATGAGGTAMSLTSGANKFSLVANPICGPVNWNLITADATNFQHLTSSFTVFDPNLGVFVSSNGTTVTPQAGASATATATLTSGTVSGLTLTNAGSGYITAPTVTIAAPTSGTTATATATIGGIVSLNVSAGGSGYTTAPTVSFTGGGGSGFAADVLISGGAVTGFNITNAGSGYSSAPTVSFVNTGTGGSGATATASINGFGIVTGFTITNAGSGYGTTVPTVTMTAAPSSKQQAGYIQSGEAFFVQNDASGTTPTLNILESHKGSPTSSATNVTVFGESSNVMQQLTINTYHTADNQFADGAVAVFGSKYKAAFNNDNINKFINFKETFGLVRENKILGLEARPLVTSTDTLYCNLSNYAKSGYTFVIEGSNFSNTTATLQDKYTGTKQAINLAGTTRYNFTVNDDTASAAKDRFIITFGSTNTSTTTDIINSLFVKMSPNPVSNQLTISFKNATTDKTIVRVVNTLGRIVKTVNAGNIATGNISIALGNLSSGIYTVQLLTGGKIISTQKIVKQ